MNSRAKNTLKRSTSFTLTIAVFAITLFAARTSAQHLQQGVSVQLVPTTNATPMPAADNEDAWIVSITADGKMYFGIDPVTAVDLADKMKQTPRRRDAKFYVKADARVPFAAVKNVLATGHTVFFGTAVLLTAQSETPQPGTIVSPNGLEVLVGPALPAGSVTTVVQLLTSGQQRPLLRVNGNEISWPALESTLRRHFQKGDEKVILLKADGRLPFAQVVQAIDASRSAGANVILSPIQ